MQEPALSDIVQSLTQAMETVLTNLIPTFTTICQPRPWESNSNPEISSTDSPDGGLRSVEVDLYPLIRDAMGHCAIPALMGKQFLKDYPTVLDDLWVFDESFLPLISGLPAWLPIPSIQRSISARNRLILVLLSWLGDYKTSLSGNVASSKDFSDVSEVVRMLVDT